MLAENEEPQSLYRGLNPAFVRRVWARRRKEPHTAPIQSGAMGRLSRAEKAMQVAERELLSDMPPRIRELVRAGCHKHRIELSRVMSPSRKDAVVMCRDEIQYRIRSMPGKRPSYPQIARWLGRSAHTDVLHAVARHAARTGEPNLTSCDYEARKERVRGQAIVAMRKLRANRTTGKDTHS